MLGTLRNAFEPVVHVPPSGPARFDPHLYNEEQLERFNCYAAALDLPSAGMARPGQLASRWSRALAEGEIIDYRLEALLERDGLERIREHGTDLDKHRVIALGWGVVPMFGVDFHAWKLTPQGWVGKEWDNVNGRALPPSNLDRSGKVISDLSGADRGFYSYLVGYFAETEKGLLIRRRNDIPDRSSPQTVFKPLVPESGSPAIPVPVRL